jgi:multiple sugar transport system permease protein
MAIIGGLQGGFQFARIMTQGGPTGTTTTLAYYIFTEGFNELRLGFASSVSWVLFIIIFGATLVQWKYGNRQTEA